MNAQERIKRQYADRTDQRIFSPGTGWLVQTLITSVPVGALLLWMGPALLRPFVLAVMAANILIGVTEVALFYQWKRTGGEPSTLLITLEALQVVLILTVWVMLVWLILIFWRTISDDSALLATDAAFAAAVGFGLVAGVLTLPFTFKRILYDDYYYFGSSQGSTSPPPDYLHWLVLVAVLFVVMMLVLPPLAILAFGAGFAYFVPASFYRMLIVAGFATHTPPAVS